MDSSIDERRACSGLLARRLEDRVQLFIVNLEYVDHTVCDMLECHLTLFNPRDSGGQSVEMSCFAHGTGPPDAKSKRGYKRAFLAREPLGARAFYRREHCGGLVMPKSMALPPSMRQW